ncbi:cytochrome P450 [Actinocorallia lasiicapitis]
MTTAEIPFIDLFRPEFTFADPSLAEARERHWYASTAVGTLVLRYQEAADLLADGRLGPGGDGHLALHGITDGPVHRYLGTNMSGTERADHARLRSVLAPFLTPQRVGSVREFAARTARRLAAELPSGEPSDLVGRFADPLALLTFCRLTGLDAEGLRHCGSADAGLVFALALSGEDRSRVETSMSRLFAYLEETARERRRTPGDDVMSAALRGDLPDRQRDSLLISLIMGGHDASAHQLGAALAVLAEHPAQWEVLAADPGRVPGAVEESLRWAAHTHTLRFVREEMDYQGRRFTAGEVVAICNWTANRDPRVFARPDVFDVARARPRLPLAFGGGAYFCPGSILGKMIMEVGVEALTGRFLPPEPAGTVIWRPPLAAAFAPAALPLRLSER